MKAAVVFSKDLTPFLTRAEEVAGKSIKALPTLKLHPQSAVR